MRTRWLAGATLAVVLALLAGCGGGGGGGTGGDSGSGGGAVTVTQRSASLSALGTQFDALQAADPATARQKLVTWLQGRSEFEASGIAPDGSVWARFTDGRLAIVPVGKVPNPNRSAALPAVRSAHGRAASTPANLPFDGPAFVGNAMGPLFQEWCANYREWLRNANYDVQSTATTVEGLKAVQGAGLFYIDCHFGEGVDRSGWHQPAVWTADTMTAEREAAFADDLKAGNLNYMYASVDKDAAGKQICDWHYAITAGFVKKYMSFAPKSFVFIDGCTSSNDTFRNAVFEKGASVYAGWTAIAEDLPAGLAGEFLFDRLLGANDWPPEESPRQRPFDWQSVLGEMANEGRDLANAAGTGHLDIRAHPSDDNPFGILAPSIATMFVHPYEQKLYIYGIFGDNPGENGKVTVGGAPLQVLEWGFNSQINMDQIICKIPDSGAGAWGDVQVSVRNHKSNTHQLSHYKGKFTLTHQAGPLKYEVKLTLQFRVDLLKWRLQPAKELNYFDDSVTVDADMASTGEWVCSGTYSDGSGSMTWSGSGSGLHNNIDGGSADRSLMAVAWFQPDQRTMQVAISGGIKDGRTVVYTDKDGNVSTIVQSIIYGLSTFDGKHDAFPSFATVSLGSDYSILKGSKQATASQPLLMGYDTQTLSWDAITCDSPPKDDSARSWKPSTAKR